MGSSVDPLLPEERAYLNFALERGDALAIVLAAIILRLTEGAAVIVVDVGGPPDHTMN